jgi:hypothetical protein
MAAAGFMFIVPETESRIAGAAIGVIMIFMFWLRRKRESAGQNV